MIKIKTAPFKSITVPEMRQMPPSLLYIIIRELGRGSFEMEVKYDQPSLMALSHLKNALQ